MFEKIPLETAKQLIDAAENKADEIGVPSVITVANPDGNMAAQHRMDDAWLASANISHNKAYTAAALKMPTHELAESSQPGNSLFGLQTTDDGRIAILGGGFPLERDGEIVGTIASNGGQVDEDITVARAGIDQFQTLTH